MKQFMNKLKIKHKLIIIIMTTVIFSLLLVGSVLIISERYISKQSMVDKLRTVSLIIADRSTAALSFYDESVATEVLSALEHESSVVLGCIYDEEQTIFAVYAVNSSSQCPKKPELNGYRFYHENFEIIELIILDKNVIGSVYIRATLEKLNARLIQFILLVLSMIIIAGIAAYYIAKKQQAIISAPILHLADFARHISIEADYTSRLPPGGEDEIGTLNNAFNNMLEQIYKRQQARNVAEKALSEREQDLVVTLNSIGDAVIVTDINGKVTRMNPVAEKLTGWSFSDAQSQMLKTVFPIVDASTHEMIENPVEKVMSTGETVFLSNHTTLLSKDGTQRQIADSAAPIRNKDNSITGLILVFNDVTEQYKLREAAAKSKRDLQAIMDNSPAAIHVEDRLGRIIFINKKFDKLHKIQGKNVINKKIYEVMSKDIADEILRQDEAVLSAGQAIEAEEISSEEDGLHTYSTIKFPLFNEENKIYAVCSIGTDITEKKQQEEQLRRSQKMDALGKLTGGIAHDYNNLLGIIMGYAEILNEQLSSDSGLAKYAGEIKYAAERGAKLTKKLLAFTRHKNADAKVLNINDLLREQQLMLEKTLTVRITLELDLAENLWPIWLDGGDLEDAIINMSINASHAISGNGRLTFRTQNKEMCGLDAKALRLNAGDYVLLCVTDTGCGMGSSTCEKIFDPFFTTKGEKGTGLGMSQVYGFVKRSGGEIKVYSEPGKGTRFAIYFPRSEKSDSVSMKIKNIKKETLGGSESVLVVDDEVALVELAKDILTNQGYQVFTATSGEQALALLKKESIDLMLSDVIMPKMNGYDLANKVIKDYPRIKIQMASGFADGRDEHMKDSYFYHNLLYKPYTSIELLTYIRKLLDEEKIIIENEVNVVNKVAKENKTEKNRRLKNTSTNRLSIGRILVMDDEEDVLELFSLSLEMLGYDTIYATNSDEAIALFEESIEYDNKVDAMILDLNNPTGLSGREVAALIRNLKTDVKIIVCSGNTVCPEMVNYQDYGFDGALEKTFNRDVIKKLLDKLLS